jgi:tetratricopeptide (TPR) repeat protein
MATRESAHPRLADPTPWPEHIQHTERRFPGEAAVAIDSALAIELFVEPAPETLFVQRSVPVWMNDAAVDQLLKGGEKQIRAMPRDRRMSHTSATKILDAVPDLIERTPAFQPLGREVIHPAMLSWNLWKAVEAYQPLANRTDTGAEAGVHLAQTYVRLAQPSLALTAFRRAEELARTPYEKYLTRVLAGALLERVGQRAEALAAFRGALEVVPRAQAASFALAPFLFEADRRDDAARLLAEAVREPLVAEPLWHYFDGDPAAWPEAIAALRRGLRLQ